MAQIKCSTCGSQFWSGSSFALNCRSCTVKIKAAYMKGYQASYRKHLSEYGLNYMRERRDGDKFDVVKCDRNCSECKYKDCIEPITDDDTLPLWDEEEYGK